VGRPSDSATPRGQTGALQGFSTDGAKYPDLRIPHGAGSVKVSRAPAVGPDPHATTPADPTPLRICPTRRPNRAVCESVVKAPAIVVAPSQAASVNPQDNNMGVIDTCDANSDLFYGDTMHENPVSATKTHAQCSLDWLTITLHRGTGAW